MGCTAREPTAVDGINVPPRWAAWAGFSLLALLCVASVWPVLASQTIPAFQQDWTWPLSRGLALQWLHAFIGLWDERSFGQANALPWQTYAVVVAVAVIAIFGSATGLALWIAALEFAAGCSCIFMLSAFGVRSPAGRFVAALLYALGPVAFVRIAAGHLAYVVAYALLPLAIGLARAAIERPHARAALGLGIIIGLSGCQIQFLAIGWIAVLALAAFVSRSTGWIGRLSLAAAVSLVIGLQALLPLAFSSTSSQYAAQPALVNFEYNNSSRLASAAVMLGYFTRYYETHALAGAFVVLYVVLVVSAAVAVWANPRAGLYGIALIALGTILTAGLYGPLGGVLAWAFRHDASFAVFRDLHYFSALTAVGLALCLGLALQRLRNVVAALPALALVVWICAPTIAGSALRGILVPRAYVSDALSVMQTVQRRGPGRVLWLPAEEPVGLRGATNVGRDFTAYGPAGNPSVSDDHQNPQLAYALAKLRAGAPDWNAFSAMNVRYIVFRSYVRSNRGDNFGTGFPLAIDGLSDAVLGRLLQHTARLTVLRTSSLSTVYELPGSSGFTYSANVNAGAMLYSELQPRRIALASGVPARLGLTPSDVTADPRAGWVSDTLGRRYRSWLADSIYPFVWTVSGQALPFTLPRGDCIFAGALPRGALLRGGSLGETIRGNWRRYRITPLPSPPTLILVPSPGDVTALVDRPCPAPSAATGDRAFVFASGYDAGWKALENGRWMSPALANGWMMAWPGDTAPERLVYVPAFAQLAGVILTVLIVALALVRAKRS